MSVSRVIEVSFGGGSIAYAKVDTAYFYNNGILFKPTDLDLPASYQVHWADSPQASSTLETIGTAEGAPIPDDLWNRSRVIYGWIYLHPTEDSGVTAYEVRIYKNVRAGLPDGTEPTPAEQSTIDQLIGALNGAVEQAEDAQEAIENMSVSATTLAEGASATVTKSEQDGVVHLAFGIPKGATGDDGYSPTANVSKTGKVATITITDKNGTTSAQVEDGTDGIDGISPSVSVTDITGGHRVVITDKDGTKSFDVEDGATGATPNLTIGTVTTLEPDASATATITGTAEDPVLNLGIPRGQTGEVTEEEFTQLKEDLTNVESDVGIYTPITGNGTSVTANTAFVIAENISLRAGIPCTFKFKIDQAITKPVYCYFREDASDEDRTWSLTINAGSTEATRLSYTPSSVLNNAKCTGVVNATGVKVTVEITEIIPHKNNIEKLQDSADAVFGDLNYLASGFLSNGTVAFTSSDVTTGDVIRYSFDTYNTAQGFIEFLDSNDTRIAYIGKGESGGTSEHYEGDYVIPNNFATAKVCIQGPLLNAFFQNKKGSAVVQEINAEIDKIKTATIIEKDVSPTEWIKSSLSFASGFVKTDGTVNSSDTYQYAEITGLKTGDIIKVGRSWMSYRFVTAYFDGSVRSTVGAENVKSYTVPAGVNSVIVTCPSNQVSYADVVCLVRMEKIYENSAKPKSDFTLRKPRVTFIDDDGYAEFYTYLVPLMETYGVPICSAYSGDDSPNMLNPTYMTKAQCDRVVELGGEILVHGGKNLVSDFSTVAEAEQNVLASKANLHNMGFDSDIYVYPQSGNNVEIREMISKHFSCAFKTAFPQKYDGRCNDKCIPHYFLHRTSWGGYYDDQSAPYAELSTHSLDYMKALIDECVANNSWLVVMTHAWMMPIGCSYRLEHDATNGIPADLDEFALLGDAIEYIQTLQTGGSSIEIVTASEGFEMFQNAMQVGDYLGYWNESIQDTSTYQHLKAGVAINKCGDYDLPTGNKIVH